MGAILRQGPGGLWLPGQTKPQGIPGIDWTHPLTRRLLFYAFDTGYSRIDLVSGKAGGPNSSNGTPPVSGSTIIGAPRLYQVGSQTDFFTLNVGNGLTSAVASVAWACIGTPVGSPTQNGTGLFEYDVAAPGGSGSAVGYLDCEYHNQQTGTLQSFSCYGDVNGSNPIFFTPGNSDARYMSAVDTMDGTTRTLYGNGVSQGTIGDTSTKIAPATSLSIGYYTSPGTPVNSTFSFSGVVPYWALWNRTLTATEAMQLHLDPYCFLIPQLGVQLALPPFAWNILGFAAAEY